MTVPSGTAGTPLHAIVPAAGRAERFGTGELKQLSRVAGRPLVAWTVERLLAFGCASVVVAFPEEVLAAARHALPDDPRVSTVTGGATRQASVASALAESPAAAEQWVAVHDGARAVVALSDLAVALIAAEAGDGSVLGRDLTDTLKRVEEGRIVETLDRRALFRAETPQIFRRRTLERAFEAARRDRFVGTDEASLVERLGGMRIAAVRAEYPNPKLTYPEDLAEIERLLDREAAR